MKNHQRLLIELDSFKNGRPEQDQLDIKRLQNLTNDHTNQINSFHSAIYPEGLLSALEVEYYDQPITFQRLSTLFHTIYPNH